MVRDPGGLQGDIEYIPFNRDAPEKAFGKILEMLSALSPRATTQSPAVSDPKLTESVSEQLAETKEAELAKPDGTWTTDAYEMAAVRAVYDEDTIRLSELTSLFKASALGNHPDKAAGWDAFVEYAKLNLDKGGKLQRIKEIEERHPTATTMY